MRDRIAAAKQMIQRGASYISLSCDVHKGLLGLLRVLGRKKKRKRERERKRKKKEKKDVPIFKVRCLTGDRVPRPCKELRPQVPRLALPHKLLAQYRLDGL